MPIGDLAILEVVLLQLAARGFTRVTLAVGYLADLIGAVVGDGRRYGLAIDYSMEPEPLGTAGPIGLIGDLSDTFLVMNGDLLTDLDYADLAGASPRGERGVHDGRLSQGREDRSRRA